jgi:gluconolactonase
MYVRCSPKLSEARIFTSLPDRFRYRDTMTEWAQANRNGKPVDSFLEGPVFDTAGNLYVADIPFGRVFRIDQLGNWELICEYDGEPNGMKFRNDNELVIADYKNGLLVLDINTGQVASLLGRRSSERFKGVNDLIFDASRNLYFTDQGQTGMHDPTGRLYRFCPDGRLDLLLDNIPSPNGVVLNADESVLFVAVTRGNAIWRAPLMADGSLSKVGCFFSSYGPSGPDGLAMDLENNLLVANPGLGYVWQLNGRGEPISVWTSPVGTSCTNLAFGGPDRKTVYCTESATGTILQFETQVPGTMLNRDES